MIRRKDMFLFVVVNSGEEREREREREREIRFRRFLPTSRSNDFVSTLLFLEFSKGRRGKVAS